MTRTYRGFTLERYQGHVYVSLAARHVLTADSWAHAVRAINRYLTGA